ncbi:helix-turn-helix domain-containing protein [Halorubrum sp. Ib24]|uniref:helix-turn-helix domain-containing protein n=1 Tax=unclassified Halorubrum TaxID=2642239 RepID=UPI000B98C181|nr:MULTISPECIES: helix-turn-helix domain-containing protein [unclassified Halorubrum]OYR39713.1 helix-turn-helix domain-containing protein [Halorubrum sp. Ib24]OYR45218.1 helix-turn-helix domain-containing protein [Halorubrum sp. Eb13]OYR47107.1 helix-turn-helix domain-containing protein [Halorubrum sp. Hd13]OYR55180.1 helix-turn-helix domain-containing protein [Halorubrum sp. Ea1]
MPQARLLVDLPDGPWIADVSREFPDAGFRVLTAVPGESAGFALVRVSARDVDAVLSAMESHDALASVSVMAREDGVATVRIETDAPLLLLAAKRSGLPIEMPLDIEDGVAEVEVTGEHERVAEMGRRLSDLGLEFEVERVRQRVNPARLLTDRQRELLLAAVDLGYYDVPRRATLTEVAEHVGIAKSTCSETLQRVERTVVREFVDDLPSHPVDEETEVAAVDP